MAKDYSINLLPPEDQPRKPASKPKHVKEDIALHQPGEEKVSEKPKEKKSWWKRRKQKKQKDKALKLAQQSVKKVDQVKKNKPINPELFSDMIAEEPKEHWWSAKQQDDKESFIEPEAKVGPKKVEPEKVSQKIKIETPKVKEPEETTRLANKRRDRAEDKEKEAHLHQVEKPLEETFEINLVSDVVSQEFQKQSWWLAGATVAFVLAFWIVLGGVTIMRVKDAEQAIAVSESELNSVERIISEAEGTKNSAELLQSQFDAVQSVLDNHIIWTNVFESLEDVTIPSVYYLRISGEENNNEVFLEAVAKDFASAARQIRAFEKAPDFVNIVEVNQATTATQPGAQLPVQVVLFDIRLELTEDFLQSYGQ